MKKLTKLLILTFSFSLLVFHSSAQRIHFCDSTNHWVTKGYDSVLGYVTCYYYYGSYGVPVGQVEDDGYYYYNLTDSVVQDYGVSGSTGFVIVREDTARGIIYFLLPPTTTISCKLYDYNLHTGDTVHYQSYSYILGHAIDPIIDSVISVDSVLIGSLYYKRVTLLEIDTDWYYAHKENRIYTYVEGIGSLSKPTAFMGEGDNEILKCFRTEGTQPITNIMYPYPYATPFPTFTDTVYFTNDCASLVIPPLVSVPENIRLIPNPANELSKLACSQIIPSGKLIIYNTLGQSIANITIENQQEITIGQYFLNHGIYFYYLTDNITNKVFSGKILYSP